ncbi:MAG: sigma-70 family RNA polymerase sigma factor [Myxococcota bacterium]|nr:sigma-70 family RNA polymerase sigma factor [Myxococcota bacterium]
MNAEQEQEIARQIRAAENDAREAVSGLAVAEVILQNRPTREERTRAGAVQRLALAVEAVQQAAESDSSLVGEARRAQDAWSRAEDLRWQLALSARHIARGEARKLASVLMGVEDLVQEGFIGLLRAAMRFDPDRGIRFTTYGRWWARAQMTRAIEMTGRTVRLPGGAVEQLRNLRAAVDRMSSDGSEHSLVEIAEEVGIDPVRAELLLAMGGTFSLDDPEDDGLALQERIASNDRGTPVDSAILRDDLARVQRAFDEALDDRERFILTHHFGLDGREALTMAQIGLSMGLSRERVRQIEHGALKRLRRRV